MVRYHYCFEAVVILGPVVAELVESTTFIVNMFNFTPLLGAQSISSASQSLLELDGGVKILVDIGWDDAFDPDKLKELERYVRAVS